MVKYIVATLIVVLLVFGFRLANYLGAFKNVEVSETFEPAKKLVFKNHVGAYHKIVPVIEEVETWAREHNIDCHLSFGEYLDNPDEMEEARLRSHGGCIVENLPTELPPGFQSEEIPAQNFIRAQFEGSPGIGPLKVYPIVRSYAKQHQLGLRGPILEVYEIHKQPSEGQSAMSTTYFFFLAPTH